MSEPRRVAVATFGRSDFSILRPLCRRLLADPGFDVGWWAAGAHFEPTSGRTIDDVESSGIPIWARIDCGDYDRSAAGTVRIMSRHMDGFAAAASRSPDVGVTVEGPRPELLLILGDRFEAVSAGLAMVPIGLPVGHLSGGSITEGAIDDVFRHCLTKIAAVHFCDLAVFARRIQHMGEPADRIFTTGALGLDAITATPTQSFARFVENFGFSELRPGYVLATLHPESRRPELTAPLVSSMLNALADTGRQVVLTYPNADPGSDEIVAAIESAAGSPNNFVVRGFGADWYPTAMAHAGLMVGNSSGGIIEAASFALPVVDIGDRQKGRDHGPNVLHCGRERSAIRDAIGIAADPVFASRASAGNIYGDGRGAERVVAALRVVDPADLAAPKRFAEPDREFTGSLMELG